MRDGPTADELTALLMASVENARRAYAANRIADVIQPTNHRPKVADRIADRYRERASDTESEGETTMTTPAETFMREHTNDYDTHREHYAYSLPDAALTFTTMAHLRRAVTDSGSHFFDRDAMHFFRSRIGDSLYGHRFFVTSEAISDDAPRVYSVRWVGRYTNDTCLQINRFDTRFTTRDKAVAFAKLAAKTIEACNTETGY